MKHKMCHFSISVFKQSKKTKKKTGNVKRRWNRQEIILEKYINQLYYKDTFKIRAAMLLSSLKKSRCAVFGKEEIFCVEKKEYIRRKKKAVER